MSKEVNLIEVMHTKEYYLNDIHVIPEKNLIKLQNETVHIQPKHMEVLTFLCVNKGKVISSDRLIEVCWRGSYINDSPLHKCIAQLRKVLKDTTKSPSYIKTIPRKGYMIIAQVEFIESQHSNTWFRGAPYPGQEPYTTDQQAIYFGCTAAIKEINSWLNKAEVQPNWFNYFGSKGSGKTSFINAGLIPTIDKLNRHKATLLEYQIVKIEPNRNGNYVSNIITQLTDKGLVEQHSDSDDFTLVNKETKTLLIIDNFELLLDDSLVNEAQISVLKRLLSLFSSNNNYFLFTATQSPSPIDVKELGLNINAIHNFEVAHLSSKDIRDIISKPIEAAGLNFEVKRQTNQSLLTRILADLSKGHVSLINIQGLMLELYKNRTLQQITFAAYEELGGISKYLAGIAEQTVSQLSAEQQFKFNELMFYLVNVNANGGEATLGKVNCKETLPSHLLDITQSLMGSGIFTAIDKAGETITLSHIDLLNSWPRLAAWLDCYLSDLYTKHDLRTITDRWLLHKKDKTLLISNEEYFKQVRNFSESYPLQVSADQQKYINDSRKKIKKTLNVKYSVFALFTVFLISLASLLMIQLKTSQELANSKEKADSLIVFMLNDLKEQLQPIGKLEVLDMVGNKAFDYFSKEGTDNLADEDVILWVKALHIIGEGQFNRLNFEDSYRYFEQSKSALNTLLITYTNKKEALELLMLSEFWLGYISFEKRQYQGAEEHWSAYLRIAKKLITLGPNETKWKLEASYALNNLGSVAEKRSQFVLASGYFEESIKLKLEALMKMPSDLNLISDVADTISWNGLVLEKKGNLVGAISKYKLALEFAEKAYSLDRKNAQLAWNLAILHHRNAHGNYNKANLESAQEHLNKAQKLFEYVIKNDPENFSYKEQLLVSYILEMRVLRHKNELESGLLAVDKAKLLVEEFKISDKYSTNVKRRELWLIQEQALLIKAMGHDARALEKITLAVNQYNEHLANSESHFLRTYLLLTRFKLEQNKEESVYVIEQLKSSLLKLRKEINKKEINYEHASLYIYALKNLGLEYKTDNLLNDIHMSDFNFPDFKI